MVGDIFRVAVVGHMFNQVMINTFHFLQSEGTDDALTASRVLGNAVAADIIPLFLPAQAINYRYDNVESQKIWPDAVTTRVDAPQAIAGTGTGDPLPATVALCLKRTSSFAGRKFRGRAFLAGVASENYSTGSGRFIPGPVLAAAASALSLTLVDTLAADTFQPIIWGKTTHLFQLVISSTYDTIPRSQRRRELGVGI